MKRRHKNSKNESKIHNVIMEGGHVFLQLCEASLTIVISLSHGGKFSSGHAITLVQTNQTQTKNKIIDQLYIKRWKLYLLCRIKVCSLDLSIDNDPRERLSRKE